MCAIALCSVWPDQQRQHEERAEHQHDAQRDLEHLGHSAPPPVSGAAGRPAASGRGPQTCGSGTPGAGLAPAGRAPPCPSTSDSPGSFAPGQAFATRAASTKSLRSGFPSKPSAAAADQVRVARRSRRRTSRRSRARARPRPRRPRSPRRAPGRRPARGCAAAGARAAPMRPEVGHHVEARLLGVVELVDRGQPVEVGRTRARRGRRSSRRARTRRARPPCPDRTRLDPRRRTAAQGARSRVESRRGHGVSTGTRGDRAAGRPTR